VFHSLRFRLPALFLAAIVLAGLVSTAVAVSVSQRYAQTTLRKQAFRELASEAAGIDKIYYARVGKSAPPSSLDLELASGDQIFYVQRAKGIDLFPGPTPAYTLLPRRVLDSRRILAGQTVRFEFTRPGGKARLLGFARPVKLGDQIFGAIILARPTTRLNQRWLPIFWRLLPAFFAFTGMRTQIGLVSTPTEWMLCGLIIVVATAGKLAGLPFVPHPHQLRHACGYYLASHGHDTRAIQDYLGHKNIQHTVRYTEMAPHRFENFWTD